MSSLSVENMFSSPLLKAVNINPSITIDFNQFENNLFANVFMRKSLKFKLVAML